MQEHSPESKKNIPVCTAKALKAMRSFCLTCQGGSSSHVASCLDSSCALHSFRLATLQKKAPKKLPNALPEVLPKALPKALLEELPEESAAPGENRAAPLRAIRSYCINCAGDKKEARLCNAGKSCLLWSFRFGVSPETYRRVMQRLRGPKALLLPGFTTPHKEGR